MAETDEQVKEHLVELRERMAATLAADPAIGEEAVRVLDRVFPEDWADAPLAVIWVLGNAARFGDPDTTGICTPAFAQDWLDRLVDAEGNPRDSFGRSVIEGLMEEDALARGGSWTNVFDRGDRFVLEVALLKTVAGRASRDEVHARLVEHLTGYADSLVEALYEPEAAAGG